MASHTSRATGHSIVLREGDAGADRALLEKRLQTINSEIVKIVDAIAAVEISDSLAGRLKLLEQERKKQQVRACRG